MPGVQMPHWAAPCAMKGLLQCREPAVLGQALDGLDRAACRLTHRDETGAGLPAVEEHRAGAAITRIAADLGAGQSEVVAQGVRQSRDRRDVERHRLAIDGETQSVCRRASAWRETPQRAANEFERRLVPVFHGRPHISDRRERAQMMRDNLGEPAERDADERKFKVRQALRDRAARADGNCRAHGDVSADSMTAATMAIEITRYLRAPSLTKEDRASPLGLGISNAVTISSSARAVRDCR